MKLPRWALPAVGAAVVTALAAAVVRGHLVAGTTVSPWWWLRPSIMGAMVVALVLLHRASATSRKRAERKETPVVSGMDELGPAGLRCDAHLFTGKS